MRRRQLHWTFLGRVPYAPTVALQEKLRQDVRFERGPEHFLLLEHDPVFTRGRNAADGGVVAGAEWLAERGVEVHATNRGGQTTYHGPGQLVGYPIVNLDPDRRDVRRFVRDLQETLIRTLADLGIEARRREGQAYVGVWVDDAKIASIGVHLARWITIHGFALNVSTDLALFDGIVACGLPGVEMTSVAELLGRAPELGEVARIAAGHFGDIFARDLVEVAADSLTFPSS